MSVHRERLFSLLDPAAPAFDIDHVLPDCDEDEVNEWLDRISDGRLRTVCRNRYQPVLLNLAAVFHERWPMHEIESMAVRCTKHALWSNCATDRYVRSLTADLPSNPAPRLRGLDHDRLQPLLAQGRGLVLCVCRFGLSQFVPLEMAMLGLPVWTPLKPIPAAALCRELDALRSALGPRAAQAGAGGDRVANALLWHNIPADRSDGTALLASALRRGESVVMLPDGNIGVDGVYGDSSRITVKFCGFSISVKSGAARLAWFARAPLASAIAIMDSADSGHVVWGDVIEPPKDRRREACAEFVNATMQSLYSFFESYLLKYPEQWPGIAALHQWRQFNVESAAPPPDRVSPAQVEHALSAGHAYRFEQHRMLRLSSPAQGDVWLDLASLKSYKPRKWAAAMFDALSGASGLSAPSLQASHDSGSRLAAVALLAQLQASGLIR